MVGLGEAVEDVGVETDIQFFGSFNQSHESIPGGDAIETGRTKADVPLANFLHAADWTDCLGGGRILVLRRKGGVRAYSSVG